MRGCLFVCGGDRSPLKDCIYYSLPQHQVAMDSEERGHMLCPAQFPLFPLPDENNTGAFRESSVQRDVLDWYGHDLSFSGLPRKGYFRSEPATSQHSSVHQTKDTSGLEDGRK